MKNIIISTIAGVAFSTSAFAMDTIDASKLPMPMEGQVCSDLHDRNIGGINVKALSPYNQCVMIENDLDTAFTYKTFWIKNGTSFVPFNVEDLGEMSKAERKVTIIDKVIEETVLKSVHDEVVAQLDAKKSHVATLDAKIESLNSVIETIPGLEKTIADLETKVGDLIEDKAKLVSDIEFIDGYIEFIADKAGTPIAVGDVTETLDDIYTYGVKERFTITQRGNAQGTKWTITNGSGQTLSFYGTTFTDNLLDKAKRNAYGEVDAKFAEKQKFGLNLAPKTTIDVYAVKEGTKVKVNFNDGRGLIGEYDNSVLNGYNFEIFEAGFEAGYEKGFSDGYEQGYEAGYRDGFNDGVNSVK